MQIPTHLVGMQFTRTVFSFYSKDYAEEKRNKIVVRLLRRCHSIFDWKSEKNRDIAGAPMAWQWDSLGV
jgi:hypothetical protein